MEDVVNFRNLQKRIFFNLRGRKVPIPFGVLNLCFHEFNFFLLYGISKKKLKQFICNFKFHVFTIFRQITDVITNISA